MKCLVTGGAGFIGSNLVDSLIERGDEVVIIDNLSNGKKENINPKAKFIQADIRNINEIKDYFEGIDYVFHLAALASVQPSIEDPVGYNEVNTNGTLNVLLCAKNAGVKKIVYSASSAAYGDQKVMPLAETMPAHPISPYGLQKYVGELYCRMFSDVYGLPTVSLRYFNVYGERQPIQGAYTSVLGIFTRQRLNNESLTIVGDGEQKRDYTNVVDVVQANILAAENDNVRNGEVINIGRGNSYSVNEVADMFSGPKIYLPERLEPKDSLADNTLAKNLLGWTPSIDLPKWIEEYKLKQNIK
ncbi:MAG TPA: SDR family oxidoreductase [Candidatus Paceibacterota bacterium]|nr:SDR family oxidoreductase [Candidatus Paceibacterota bacterium]